MTDAGPVDVLNEMVTMGGGHQGYDELVSRHVIAEIGGLTVRIAALDDIVASTHRGRGRRAQVEIGWPGTDLTGLDYIETVLTEGG